MPPTVPQVKRILFTTDLSENSRRAFQYAVGMAACFGGEIVILHVSERPSSRFDATSAGPPEHENRGESRMGSRPYLGQSSMERPVDRVITNETISAFCRSSGISQDHCSFQLHEIIIRKGKVVEEIIDAARKYECDLIVMGAHQGILGAMAVGTITKGVLQHSTIPVLVVPPPH